MLSAIHAFTTVHRVGLLASGLSGLDCTLPHVEEVRGKKLCYFILEKLEI
jgi:hypothetical protein